MKDLYSQNQRILRNVRGWETNRKILRATTNQIIAALKLSERRQGDSESLKSFVTGLKILVKDWAANRKSAWFETRSLSIVSTGKCVRSASTWPMSWHAKRLSRSFETTKWISGIWETGQRPRPNRQCTESRNRPRSNKNDFKKKPPTEKSADSREPERI